MIAVLDPALFLVSNPGHPPAPEELAELEKSLRGVASIIRLTRARLVADDWYWGPLTREFVGPLSRSVSRPGSAPSRLSTALATLLAYPRVTGLPDPPARGKTKLWGVKPLFGWERLPSHWLGVMERVLIGCAQKGEDTLLITRSFVGRNEKRHEDRKCILREKDPWRCYAHVPGAAPMHVPCVRSARNLDVPWTARFDERLPESGTFPFCPPARWWRRKSQEKEIHACRTVRSKPAWLDRFGNGWTQPTTGGEYHWDVFLEDPSLEAQVGLNAINVVAWGTTEPGKTPGELHHVPEDKKGRLKPGAGWRCPD